MKKKILSILLSTVLLTSCHKETLDNLTYQEAKDFIIENYSYNKANYLYSTGKYKTVINLTDAKGVYKEVKNTDEEYIFPQKTGITEKAQRNIKEVDVINYMDLNDSLESSEKLKADKTLYQLENNSNLILQLEGADKLSKIIELPYIKAITNKIGTALADRNVTYSVTYRFNYVGLYEEINLHLDDNQANGNVLDVDYTTTFSWVLR